MIGLKKATSSRSLFESGEAGRRGPTYKLPRGHYFYLIAPLNLSLFDIWALANPIKMDQLFAHPGAWKDFEYFYLTVIMC
jgi:hypothetical protein